MSSLIIYWEIGVNKLSGVFELKKKIKHIFGLDLKRNKNDDVRMLSSTLWPSWSVRMDLDDKSVSSLHLSSAPAQTGVSSILYDSVYFCAPAVTASACHHAPEPDMKCYNGS